MHSVRDKILHSPERGAAALTASTVFGVRIGMRHCNSCNRDLPNNTEYFYRSRKTRALESGCIDCRRRKARDYYQKTRSVAARRAAA
jgi:hypothetical protein